MKTMKTKATTRNIKTFSFTQLLKTLLPLFFFIFTTLTVKYTIVEASTRTANATTPTTITTTAKHNIQQRVMQCINSTYDNKLNIFESSLQDENGDEFLIYTKDNIKSKWFVSIVDTRATIKAEDDEIIDLYSYNSYIFNNKNLN